MNIYKAMAAVMEDCGAVAKDSRNEKQKYKYRGIDATMNALNPALRKNKVFVVPEVLEQSREERLSREGNTLIYSITKVKYTFYADDGSNVSAVVIGEGMDSGDKSMNKAMSAAFKYALFQTLCIPTEEMHDSEEDSPEVAPKMTDREKKIAQIKKLYDAENYDKILDYYRVGDITELSDATLSKILAQKMRGGKNEPGTTDRPAD